MLQKGGGCRPPVPARRGDARGSGGHARNAGDLSMATADGRGERAFVRSWGVCVCSLRRIRRVDVVAGSARDAASCGLCAYRIGRRGDDVGHGSHC